MHTAASNLSYTNCLIASGSTLPEGSEFSNQLFERFFLEELLVDRTYKTNRTYMTYLSYWAQLIAASRAASAAPIGTASIPSFAATISVASKQDKNARRFAS
jgi:hypothetical protein